MPGTGGLPLAWLMRWKSPAACLLLTGLGACGGGGGGAGSDDFLYPLWVPTDVAVVDLDGDGRADILTLAQYVASQDRREGRLVVYRQTAAGVFTAQPAQIVGRYPWRLAVGDIDGDGAVDVAVTDVDEFAVRVLLQDRNQRGRFQPALQVASGLKAYGLAVADINGDGAPDLVATDATVGTARVVLVYQDPERRGEFAPAAAVALPGVATTAVAAGDIDGDERADLAIAVAQQASGTTPRLSLGVSLQQADGTPGPFVSLATTLGVNASRLAIADYEGDGLRDVFGYFTPYSTDFAARLTVLRQGPLPGGFTAPVDTSLAGLLGIDDAVFADLDADQRPDAAVAGFFPVGSPSEVRARLHRYTQGGAGTFALVASQDLSVHASRVTAGDLDGDGRNELVVYGGDRFQVLD